VGCSIYAKSPLRLSRMDRSSKVTFPTVFHDFQALVGSPSNRKLHHSPISRPDASYFLCNCIKLPSPGAQSIHDHQPNHRAFPVPCSLIPVPCFCTPPTPPLFIFKNLQIISTSIKSTHYNLLRANFYRIMGRQNWIGQVCKVVAAGKCRYVCPVCRIR
jgi:hypothetical protein